MKYLQFSVIVIVVVAIISFSQLQLAKKEKYLLTKRFENERKLYGTKTHLLYYYIYAFTRLASGRPKLCRMHKETDAHDFQVPAAKLKQKQRKKKSTHTHT